MSRRVAIIGGNGQLGQDLHRHWKEALPDDDVVALNHSDIEVADAASVASALGNAKPHIVINTAAYHNVEAIESNPRAMKGAIAFAREELLIQRFS